MEAAKSPSMVCEAVLDQHEPLIAAALEAQPPELQTRRIELINCWGLDAGCMGLHSRKNTHGQ